MVWLSKPKSIRRGFDCAAKVVNFSSYRHFKLGAALYKGPKLISVGWNQPKSHPASKTRYKNQHAEFNCLIGTNKSDTDGSTMFVVRYTPGGQWATSKPCKECMSIIKAAGIKKVWFLNTEYQPESARLY